MWWLWCFFVGWCVLKWRCWRIVSVLVGVVVVIVLMGYDWWVMVCWELWFFGCGGVGLLE